ncbi:MAG TPA: 2-amino-4-hydroxy-6-hydroxymethyldihydropteridine diphosphokinase [Chthonomonas sp.]|jgi:2-amino-4-hydroxy-6-hydroxymethyldihydropteridine diphosphokinase|uniref:2-amino-4-hydroxy-6- hydroxymethyldihydropteridine diphosphokinase n=1 Tax=Chthonomonas sp. TaxID=2282153 RepID=UPI002B4B8E27|nr:2-amino-4-hydroxy-6-hydroxymethyldihydropteridine diphosphokinase [Chthonomonas sp.]HLH80634.1 2-amino-4-hydroxy-6-hydroxymethyldihydropteridine diphosphokinase [Chthonomonas sp.]
MEVREVVAYLGLGSSLGDRLRNLQTALKRLAKTGDITIEEVSPVYESPHLGREPEDASRYPPHLNAVIRIRTYLSPMELLEQIQRVEAEGGRERNISWGPRTIDIDILLYANERIKTELLEVPHPEMSKRAFVVIPLWDIAADLILPDGRELGQLVASECIQRQPLRRYAQTLAGWQGA